MIYERARNAVLSANISKFKASNGYVEKSLNQSGVDKSVLLDHEVRSILPTSNEERMEYIRSINSQYSSNNISNLEEIGLFIRMVPHMSYLASSKTSQSFTRADMQEHKI